MTEGRNVPIGAVTPAGQPALPSLCLKPQWRALSHHEELLLPYHPLWSSSE